MTRVGSTAYVALIPDLRHLVRMLAFIAFHGRGIAHSVRHVGTARQSGWDVAACFLSFCKRVERSRVPNIVGSFRARHSWRASRRSSASNNLE